jgi:hypothetical protein
MIYARCRGKLVERCDVVVIRQEPVVECCDAVVIGQEPVVRREMLSAPRLRISGFVTIFTHVVSWCGQK